MRSLFILPIAASIALISPLSAAEGCKTELRVFADDIHGVELTQRQIQDIAGLLMQARRHCWVHQETVAMGLINKARSTAGLEPSNGKFDWENVPLESLQDAN